MDGVKGNHFKFEIHLCGSDCFRLYILVYYELNFERIFQCWEYMACCKHCNSSYRSPGVDFLIELMFCFGALFYLFIMDILPNENLKPVCKTYVKRWIYNILLAYIESFKVSSQSSYHAMRGNKKALVMVRLIYGHEEECELF